jgi:hypothetical protein
MSARARKLLIPVLVAAAWCSLQAAPDPPQRIVAIGDVHGNLAGLVRILEHAHLMDAAHRWTGGHAVLVQTGDFTDRGQHVKGVMDLLMSLQKSAPHSGGQVYVLLGNHEAMNLLGLTQDVSPKAMAEFADSQSETRRNERYQGYVSLSARQRSKFVTPIPLYQPPSREAWLKTHPRGFVEYFDAFGPDGTYGRWLRSLPVAVKIGDTIFMHAGIDPTRAPKDLGDITEKVQKEIARFDAWRKALIASEWALPSFTIQEAVAAAQVAAAAERDNARWRDGVPAENWTLLDPEGPLWFRGLATGPAQELEAPLAKLLERYAARRFVLGHTVMANGHIGQRLGGRVVLIDTGMLSSVYRGGRASALEIVQSRLSAIYDDGTVSVGAAPEPAVVH